MLIIVLSVLFSIYVIITVIYFTHYNSEIKKLNKSLDELKLYISTTLTSDLQVQINYMNKKLNSYEKFPEQISRRLTQCEIETTRVMNALKILNQGFEIPVQSHMTYA